MRSEQPQATARLVKSLGSSRSWDATKTDAPAELLQRGFELAYFLIPDRVTAVDILTRALENPGKKPARNEEALLARQARREACSADCAQRYGHAAVADHVRSGARRESPGAGRFYFITEHGGPLHQTLDTDHYGLVFVLRQR